MGGPEGWREETIVRLPIKQQMMRAQLAAEPRYGDHLPWHQSAPRYNSYPMPSHLTKQLFLASPPMEHDSSYEPSLTPPSSSAGTEIIRQLDEAPREQECPDNSNPVKHDRVRVLIGGDESIEVECGPALTALTPSGGRCFKRPSCGCSRRRKLLQRRISPRHHKALPDAVAGL